MVWKSNFNELDENHHEIKKGKSQNLIFIAPKSAFAHSTHAMHTEVANAVPQSARNRPSVAVEPPIKNGPRGLETNKKNIAAGLVGPAASGKASPEIVNIGSAIFGRSV
jgi:hypothetical protein